MLLLVPAGKFWLYFAKEVFELTNLQERILPNFRKSVKRLDKALEEEHDVVLIANEVCTLVQRAIIYCGEVLFTAAFERIIRPLRNSVGICSQCGENLVDQKNLPQAFVGLCKSCVNGLEKAEEDANKPFLVLKGLKEKD